MSDEVKVPTLSLHKSQGQGWGTRVLNLFILLTTAFHDLLHLLQMVQVVSGIHPDKMGN